MKKAAEYLFAAQGASLAYQDEAAAAANPLLKDLDGQLRVYTDSAPTMTAHAYGWVKDRTFYLTFRGTQSRSDMLADAHILRTYLFPEGDRSVLVHAGFLSYYKSMEEKIVADIELCRSPIDTLHVMGHSLGGALATIAAVSLGSKFPELRVTCHTVGSPRVGNAGFVRAFARLITDSMRITNSDDPVTRFPISPFYTHVTGFICIDDKCIVTEATVDVSWWRRLLSLPFQIDCKAPIADHSCSQYIERLTKLAAAEI